MNECKHNNRCSGHCCRRFYLPLTPDELKYEATRDDRRTNIKYNPDEVEKIYTMVVPLESAKDAKFGADESVPPPNSGWYYTCRNLNVITGDCMAYETRPNVCRDFPFYGQGYLNKCRYRDCTWEEAKNPPIAPKALTRNLPIKTELSYAK